MDVSTIVSIGTLIDTLALLTYVETYAHPFYLKNEDFFFIAVWQLLAQLLGNKADLYTFI